MTLTFYKDNTEIMSQCVLWWQGRDQTTTGFPILPAGVMVTPSGTWANDLSLGNNKTLKTFNGSTNYISLTDNDAWYFGTSPVTICCWIKSPTIPVIRYLIWQQTDRNNTFEVSLGNGYTRCASVVSGSYIFDINSGSGSIASNTWYHITFIRSGSSQVIYIDGIQKGTTATSSAALINFTGPFYIGYEPNGYGIPSSYWYGNVKDLMIFKGRALTQPEIITLMRLTEPGKRDIIPILPGIRGVE